MEDIEYLWILPWIQKQTPCPLKYWTVLLHVEQMLLLVFVFSSADGLSNCLNAHASFPEFLTAGRF